MRRLLAATATPLLVAVMVTACGGGVQAQPASLDFGVVKTGVPTSRSITVSYAGGWGSTNLQVHLDADSTYQVTRNTCKQLTGSSTCDVTITVTPRGDGSHSGALRISGDGGASEATVSLAETSRTPSLTFDPPSVDFGHQFRGTPSTAVYVPVHIANTGKVPVALGALSVVPANYATTENDECSNRSLAPAATCLIGLLYPANTAPLGTFLGSLLVPDDITPGHVGQLNLIGNLDRA